MTQPITAARAFADAASRMANSTDTAGDLVLLLLDCVEVLGAEAAGLLVEVADDSLELLASSSHRAEELELYQLQQQNGPCFDAFHEQCSVAATSPDLEQAWPPLGARAVELGFHAVHAVPLLWRGTSIGALNIFHADRVLLGAEGRLCARTFADLTAAILTRSMDSTVSTVRRQVLAALEGRTVIEQAKGIIAYRENLEMDEAFAQLLRWSTVAERSLSDLAADIVASASART
ncbi:MAG: GAF and ANTAR domain-containing protein [Microlunatus sp.]|nr:GAF and ANTAR domain-containing protein [Microlunatus sp.]MDN5804406.1 GAF and ANTAR domain-containing protein [Microlunatus sp.]